jgi:hypothetical protein
VPPIFQPEVAADAIVWASHHPKREVNVGFPTEVAILAQKIAPGIADRYLAHTGYESQQTDDPIEPDRRDNLFRPVPGDFGAHGRFDARGHGFSVQFWLRRHARELMMTGAALAIGFVVRKLDHRKPREANRPQTSLAS